jgi:diaminopimelate decarboxylase
MSIKSAIKLARVIENDGNKFLGISFYLPRELYSPENFSSVLDSVTKAFRGRKLSVLDIGGGLDDSFSPDFQRKLEKIKRTLDVQLLTLEPGRNLLDPCIDMVVSVIGLCKRGGYLWAYVDAGIYSGLLDIKLIRKVFEISTLADTKLSPNKRYRYLICGPSSDSLDILGEYRFNVPLNVGDRLRIKNCGAYSFVMRTHFDGSDDLTLQVI